MPSSRPADDVRSTPAVPDRFGPVGFSALGFRFGLASDDHAVGNYLAGLLMPFLVDERPESVYRITAGSAPGCFVVRDGDDVTLTEGPAGEAVRTLLWDVNRRVVAASTALVLIHAAAAARDDRIVLLPAASEAGKTTLVAGLVRAGLRYVTDELVAIDPVDQFVHPYPKPMSIDVNSWPVVPELRPSVPERFGRTRWTEWQVQPALLRRDAIAAPAPASVIVFPRYDRRGRSAIERIGRAEALVQIAGQTFDTTADARATTLRTLEATVRACRCYRLTVNDLDEAVSQVIDVV